MTTQNSLRLTRREALATLLAAGTLRAEATPVKIGFVGVGNRGSKLLSTFLALPGVEIPAICDINEDNLARAQQMVEKTGSARPEGYSRGLEDYLRLVDRSDLDAVVTATPWEWHANVCVAAMKAGKYAASEVPAAITTEECWELVETSEQTEKPCTMLENVCYFRNVLAVLNMIEAGVFGELIHSEAGYQHQVLGTKLGPNGDIKWRGMHSLKRDANIYPTHPIGPVAWWANINRGDRFEYLVSMSSKSRMLPHYAAEMFGPDHPSAKRDYALGDVNTSMIRTANGVSVTLYHDTNLPRPYDLILRVQGIEGIYSGTLDQFYFDKLSPKRHEWEDSEPYFKKYEHDLWKRFGDEAVEHGHGGADYMELQQFVEAVRAKSQTPIDVYDAATWSVITPLTETSVAHRSSAVDFPDFTKGMWKEPRKLLFL